MAARYNCTPGGTSLFTDVAPTDVFCKHVHYLAAQKVMPGCGESLFCSGQVVTRDTMASVIANAIVARGGDNAVPASYTAPVTALSYSCDAASPDLHFSDVPVSQSLLRAHPLSLGQRSRLRLLGLRSSAPAMPSTEAPWRSSSPTDSD